MCHALNFISLVIILLHPLNNKVHERLDGRVAAGQRSYRLLLLREHVHDVLLNRAGEHVVVDVDGSLLAYAMRAIAELAIKPDFKSAMQDFNEAVRLSAECGRRRLWKADSSSRMST